MKVSELMSRDVVTITMSESCHAAAAKMSRHGVRHLPVVAENGTLEGIVTDRDLRHHIIAAQFLKKVSSVSTHALLEAVPVEEIMWAPVVSVRPDDELETAAMLMVDDKIGSLPVVDGGRVVGIITETDLLHRAVHAGSCCPDVEMIVRSHQRGLGGGTL